MNSSERLLPIFGHIDILLPILSNLVQTLGLEDVNEIEGASLECFQEKSVIVAVRIDALACSDGDPHVAEKVLDCR